MQIQESHNPASVRASCWPRSVSRNVPVEAAQAEEQAAALEGVQERAQEQAVAAVALAEDRPAEQAGRVEPAQAAAAGQRELEPVGAVEQQAVRPVGAVEERLAIAAAFRPITTTTRTTR